MQPIFYPVFSTTKATKHSIIFSSPMWQKTNANALPRMVQMHERSLFCGDMLQQETATCLSLAEQKSKNLGKSLSPETRSKIADAARRRAHEQKLEKARALGMNLDQYESHRKFMKIQQQRLYRARSNITISPIDVFKRKSEFMKERWRDPVYRLQQKRAAEGRRINHCRTAMMKAVMTKVVQKWWLKMPFPSFISKEERRAILQKFAREKLKKSIKFLDEEERQNKFELKKKKLSEVIKRMWLNPDFREKAVQGRKISNRINAPRPFTADTKQKISLAMRSLWKTLEFREKQNLARLRMIASGRWNPIPFLERNHSTCKQVQSIPLSSKRTTSRKSPVAKIHKLKIRTSIINKETTEKRPISKTVQEPDKPPPTRLERRPAINPDEATDAIKVYKDGKLVDIYTREEYENAIALEGE